MSVDVQPADPANLSRSRENALQHGFTGEGIVLPRDLAAEVEARRRSYAASYPPGTLHEHDLAHKAALGMVRHLQLQEMFNSRLTFRSEQAKAHWPLLREADAIERSKRLAYNPPDVVAQLKMSLGGVRWMLHEWKMLRLALDSPEGWDIKLQSRADNLAGVARAHRRLDPEKVRGGSPEQRRALVDRRIDELERLLDDPELARLDEAERQAIIAGLDGHRDPMYERLMRYEQRALRLHEKALHELQACVASRAVADGPSTGEEAGRPPDHSPRGVITIGAETAPKGPEVSPSARETRGFKPSPGSEPIELAEGDGQILPPFARHFTKEQYIATVTDPECLRWGETCSIPGPGDPLWETMAGWIEQEGLKLDVETTIRGLLGHLMRRGMEKESAAQGRADGPSKDDRPSGREVDRLQREARKKAEQDRKEKRKRQKLARHGRR